MRRGLTMVLGLLVLAACGADGAPEPLSGAGAGLDARIGVEERL